MARAPKGTRTVREERSPTLVHRLGDPKDKGGYHNILCESMEYHTKAPIPASHTSQRGDIAPNDLEPEDLYKWVAWRVFGEEVPLEGDTPVCRPNTVAYWEGAIPHPMPTRAKWHGISQTGNITMPGQINGLIRSLRAMGANGTGVPPQADRWSTQPGFGQLYNLVGQDAPLINQLRHRAMVTPQLHMVGGPGGTAHPLGSQLEASLQHPGYLTGRMRWSKDVKEGRDCPKQILFGSMDYKYCVYYNMAVWLESWLMAGGGRTSQWVFADGISKSTDPRGAQGGGTNKCKTNYCSGLKSVIGSDSFQRSDQGGILGSHSIRKLATTLLRLEGVHKDDIDYRARWESRRMQDRYTGMSLEWPDIQCATKLCEGGDCMYRSKASSGLTDDWVCGNVTPCITAKRSKKTL